MATFYCELKCCVHVRGELESGKVFLSVLGEFVVVGILGFVFSGVPVLGLIRWILGFGQNVRWTLVELMSGLVEMNMGNLVIHADFEMLDESDWF